MNKIALITANFGGIDLLKPLPEHAGIDCFYFSDSEVRGDTTNWTHLIKCNYPRTDFSPRLKSRYFKHQIHRLDEVSGYEYLVWADSTLQFRNLSFILNYAEILRSKDPRARFLAVPHPDRETVLQEYEFIHNSILEGNEYLRIRYAAEKMTEQMNYFYSKSWNVKARLWCGTFWMVENSDLYHRAWDDWWDQNLKWGLMDQLSLPVILEKWGIETQPLPVKLWDNEFFAYIQHDKFM